MTNEEIVAVLVEYGTKRYGKSEIKRETETVCGMTFKEFIESLPYRKEKPDQTVHS